MFQIKSLILYFFLLILGVFFNLTLDIIYKRNRFSKTFPKKSLKFVPYRGCGPVILDLSLILLLVEVDLILKKQGYKRDAFLAFSSSGFKMVFTLLTEIITFYV